MLGILIKKQLTEFFRSFFVDRKTNKAYGAGRVVGNIILFAVLMFALIGGMVAALSFSMALSLYESGMDWLFFTVMGIAGIVIGMFGSVFNTYASLYLAEDNELLLSMPIQPRDIILSRLVSVYLMGLLYSGIVIVPSSAVFLLVTPFRVSVLVGCILLLLIVSLITLLLSCLLGLAVASIASKLRNKSFITVIISLVFIGAYYSVYFRMETIINQLLANAVTWGGTVRDKVYPLYLFGQMGLGNPAALLIYGGVVILLCAAAYRLMSVTFLRMALAKGTVSRGTYRKEGGSVRSLPVSLLAREFKRFTSSATYMLNSALGVVLIPAAAVFIWVRRPALQAMLTEQLPAAYLCAALPAFTGLLLFVMTMNNTAAASVSMEGRTLWVLQTLPVTPRQVLTAKVEMQLLVTGIPALVFDIITAAVLFPMLHPDPLSAVLYFLVPQLYNLLYAFLCMSQGVRHVILDWTIETVAVKNNIACLVTVFAGWGLALAGAAIGTALSLLVSAALGMAGMALFTAGMAFVFFRTLRVRDEKRFVEL